MFVKDVCFCFSLFSFLCFVYNVCAIIRLNWPLKMSPEVFPHFPLFKRRMNWRNSSDKQSGPWGFFFFFFSCKCFLSGLFNLFVSLIRLKSCFNFIISHLDFVSLISWRPASISFEEKRCMLVPYYKMYK